MSVTEQAYLALTTAEGQRLERNAAAAQERDLRAVAQAEAAKAAAAQQLQRCAQSRLDIEQDCETQ